MTYEPTVLIPDNARWKEVLQRAVELFLQQNVNVPGNVDTEHMIGTPDRVVRAFAEMVAGYQQDPAMHLKVVFSHDNYDQMIHFKNIRLVSSCIHHLVPIIAISHFAYIPNLSVVGLSKVPKYLRVLANRLQVQESLAMGAVNLFQEVVKPMGCGIHIRGYHCCAITRGAMEHEMVMETTALRGCFKDNPETRAEFLQAVTADPGRIIG